MNPLPQFHLLLQPKSEDGYSIKHLHATISFTACALPPGTSLVSLATHTGPTPHQNYSSETIFANDKDGAIPLEKYISCSEGGDVQNWRIGRLVRGQVSVQVIASPRRIEDIHSSGPRCDILPEKNGLQGDGSSFIPLPSTPEDENRDYAITVEWDLSELSDSSKRAVWTFGEGPAPIEVRGSLSYYISDTHFMVGNIYSYPTKNTQNHFGFYWLGDDTPESFTRLGPVNESLFASMSELFEHDNEEKEPYRVFLRRSVLSEAFGGTAINRSYVLEYGEESAKQVTSNELLFLLAHEMVHNWLHLQTEEDGQENIWYSEGIADFYGITLPYRYGLVDTTHYVQGLNRHLSQYYTNPLRATPECELVNRWSDLLKVDLPYSRGFTMLLKTDSLIRAATQDKASLDDVALELYRKLHSHGARREQWISAVGKYLGHDCASKVLHDMLDGALVLLPERLDYSRTITRNDREVFEIGYKNEGSIVTDVIAGSRAAEAGIQEGDEILRTASFTAMLENFEGRNHVKFRRGDRNFDISYWPRSRNKVSCWQIEERTSSKYLQEKD